MTSAIAPAPVPRLRVALLGFSEFERAALASYFRLAGDRFPAYEQTDSLADARFIVADADHPGVVQEVVAAGRVADTVFIGGQAPEGALAWRMRPIDPLHVLRELDAHVALLRAAANAPASMAGYIAPAPARRASDAPPPPRDVSPDALVVGDNEAALRALERQLQGLGLTVARAGTSGKALELCGRLAFRFVFIDVDLGPSSDVDAFTLCEQLQQPPGEAAPPTVCLISARGESVDRVRASLAGCDAFLAEPIDEAALKRVLHGRGALPAVSQAARELPR